MTMRDLAARAVTWCAGFFEDGDGRPSSKRLAALAALFVTLAVLSALAGAACGIAYSMQHDPIRAERALTLLLSSIEWLVTAALAAGSGNYLVGRVIERKPVEPKP